MRKAEYRNIHMLLHAYVQKARNEVAGNLSDVQHESMRFAAVLCEFGRFLSLAFPHAVRVPNPKVLK